MPTFIGLTLVYLYLNVTVQDSYSRGWHSVSSTVARNKGILIREYEVSPRIVNYENYRVELTDCWVEEVTKTEHDFIFFEKVTKLGKPRFILNYQGQRLAPDPVPIGRAMLVPGREGYGLDLAESDYADYPNRLTRHQMANIILPDSLGNDTAYFSIVRHWKDERKYLIKAYPKNYSNAQ